MSKLRVALIGCGAVAAKHVVALRRVKQVELVGAFDASEKTLREFGAKNCVPTYASAEDLVEKGEPDILDILTPSGLHGKNVLDLMKYDRHFVVEKPLALRLDEIDRILEECDKRGLRIFVVQQNRFNPPVQQLRKALGKGRFGRLVLGTVRVRWCRDDTYYRQKKWRGTWALDGGVLTNQASHHIDMLIWMLGDVDSVVAKTATRLAQIEAEDTGVAILKFRNGALGVIEATTATRPKDLEGSISVLGEKGSVEIGGFFMNKLKTWDFLEPDDTDQVVWERYAEVPQEPAWNHTEFFRDVVDSLQTGHRGLIDGIEGRKSVELINAIYESSATGREVHLRFNPELSRLGENRDGH